MPLIKRIDVWRTHSCGKILRYNCAQDLETGKYLVLTMDFVSSDDKTDVAQKMYLIDAAIDLAHDNSEQLKWFDDLQVAIKSHDDAFGN